MKVIPREAQGVITNSHAIRQLRSTLTLSLNQREVLVGTLLGDGSLVANSWKRNYRLQAEQSHPQKEYLFWKYQIFQAFTLSRPKFRERTNAWRFRTISHPEFTEYAHLFYAVGRKVVPLSIGRLLKSPMSLAIWYVDDGALSSRRDTFILNSQSFSRAENVLLQQCLLENFGISVTLNRDRHYWRLYVSKRSAERFHDLVRPYVATSMRYKLPVAPWRLHVGPRSRGVKI